MLILIAALAALSLATEAPQAELVPTAHGKVEVIVQGSGPLVVMLPSAARSAHDFATVAPMAFAC